MMRETRGQNYNFMVKFYQPVALRIKKFTELNKNHGVISRI